MVMVPHIQIGAILGKTNLLAVIRKSLHLLMYGGLMMRVNLIKYRHVAAITVLKVDFCDCMYLI